MNVNFHINTLVIGSLVHHPNMDDEHFVIPASLNGSIYVNCGKPPKKINGWEKRLKKKVTLSMLTFRGIWI